MDPAAVALATILVGAPGVAVGLALFGPGRLSLSSRLALVVPLGFATIGVLSVGLALVGGLSLPFLVSLSVAVTVTALVAGGRGRRFRDHIEGWRGEIRADRWVHAAGLTVLVPLAVVRFTHDPVLNLADQTPLRYWADGLEVADAHRIPETSLQWGTLVPAAESKVVLNGFNGAAGLVLGRGPLAPMGALLLVLSIGLLVAAFALAREVGLRWTAPLVPLVLFGNDLIGPRNFTLDLTNYKAENWGRLMMLSAVMLGVRALRADPARDRRPEALVAGVLLGVGVGTHLIPAVVGTVFLLAYALAWGVVRARPVPVLRATGIMLVVAGSAGGLLLLSAPGEIGFGGAGDSRAYTRIAADVGATPPFDPTRYLALGEITQEPVRDGFYDPPLVVYHEFVRRTLGEAELRRPLRWVFPAAFVLAVGAVGRWGDRKLRAVAITCLVVGLVILLAGLAFNLAFEVYVMAEFGPRRLFDYPGLAAVLLVAALLELVLQRAGRSASPRVRSVPPVAAAVAVVVLTALAVPRATPSSAREQYLATGLGALEWIEENVPCRGRILADRWTLGTFQTFTRRAGVLEGMGPYLRPDVLETAVRALLDAREFFLDPLAHRSYLAEQAVAAVVVTDYNQILGGVGGPLRVAPPNLAALDSAPFLERAYESDTVIVFRVNVTDPASFPDVTSLPGYRCTDGEGPFPA